MSNTILALTRIVQAVSLVESPPEQVKLIVDSISQAINVDVCSLYRINDNQDMVLLASHGLSNSGNITLPAGKGLVGLVAKNRHTVNIADAPSHPDYFYVPRAREEKFYSFCGVPLVRFGEVIGVLVVQSTQAKQLSEESEAFLVTLASQLALIVANVPISKIKPSSTNLRSTGIIGSPGIGIGTTWLCDNNVLNNVVDAVCENVDESLKQWHDLLDTVKAEIKSEQAALGGELSDSVSGIFDAYQMLLSNKSLIERVESEIKSGHWLPGALRLSIQYYSELFRAMDDPYLKARSEDIQHLGNKLFNALQGAKNSKHIGASTDIKTGKSASDENIEESIVLIGTQVSVSEIANVPIEHLAGIVCFEGSSLSHTAVLAKAIGVPAVMGVSDFHGLQSGEKIIVDGNEGQVVLNPTEAVAGEFRQLIYREKILRKQLDVLRDEPAITKDGELIKLYANTGLLADLSPGLKNGAEGIGLYRTEIPFMMRESFPSEDEQVHVYRRVLAAYAEKPVYMRTLDIGGDKQLPYFPISHEENPALGWRGIRFTLDNIQLLMTQVRAMIRAAEGEANLHILLPMVASTYELDTFRELLTDACEQLHNEGRDIVRPKIGVMVEVPAAISQLGFWKEKIDFISIGSNDLSQYLLALDRNNSRVAKRYDHVHPAVLHEINRIVKIAKQNNIPVSLCGEMASDPVAVTLLLGMGIRSLSMSAAMLPRIKWLIKTVSMSNLETLLERALLVDNVEQIRSVVNEQLSLLGLNELVNLRGDGKK
ncbi:MAG: phosphoenolpyruvate--protein phosphotransferase [Gammaproteobacteria bacterium]|nr:phosphoenolpyruvate--protein phosphotransferase [Gammaproteobacteria bacterium]